MSNTTFPTIDILSVYFDKMLCDFADYRELIGYMCGQYVMLHDLGPARKLVAAALAQQVPGLDELAPPGRVDGGNGSRYAREAAKIIGEEHMLAPLEVGLFVPRTATQAMDQV